MTDPNSHFDSARPPEDTQPARPLNVGANGARTRRPGDLPPPPPPINFPPPAQPHPAQSPHPAQPSGSPAETWYLPAHQPDRPAQPQPQSPPPPYPAAPQPPRPRPARRQDHYRRPPKWLSRRSPFQRFWRAAALFGLALFTVLALYFLLPLRTNILLLGVDVSWDGQSTGRTDTMILTTVNPLRPYVGMLSIPRDLWVNVPGVGEQRINTAHFFAEAEQAGRGPEAALDTVQQNFGVDVGYYVRVRFNGFRAVIDALGGAQLDLPEPMGGYPAGPLTLNGQKALAFARDRAGADDFFRMQNGQFLLKSLLRQALSPASWGRLPAVAAALPQAVDTNVPFWLWPRLGLALARAGLSANGVDSRTIERSMVTPFTTSGGAAVLLPNWEAINPVLLEMFGQ